MQVAKSSLALCKIDGCHDTAKKRGWCLFHYDRWRRLGDPLLGGSRRLPPNSLVKCKIDGCDNKAVSNHFCGKHDFKFKKYGDPLGGTIQDGRSKNWRSDKNGYIYKWDTDNPYRNKITNLVFQHREIIGEAIGRPLKSSESVHHKNGDRSDNRLENLELWVKSQPAGQRVEDLVEWAKQILYEYEHFVIKKHK